MTYTQFIARLANMLAVPVDNAEYVDILPAIIDYAEGRIYRDLDLLATVVTDSSSILPSDTRNFTLPVPAAGAYDIIDQINLLESGVRTPLTPVSRSVVDTLWGASTSGGVTAQRPSVFAMTTDDVLTFGPVSGASVTIEVLGRIRPIALSVSNPTTYLSTQLPELFLIAAMIFGAGWQKNFGAGADDGASGMSWEAQYKNLLAAADQTSAREDFAGASWTSRRVEPAAQPQRG